MEAVIHQDIFALFWNIWDNNHTKIHTIVKYLLMMSDSSSLTWTAHLRLLFQMYSLPDPLNLLSGQIMPKERWKTLTKTAVAAFHERKLRLKAKNNSKLGFLNVQASGLITGRPHPALSGIFTTRDVQRSRIHIKLLSGDYPSLSNLSHGNHQQSYCCLCHSLCPHQQSPEENIVHILTQCKGTWN